MILALDQATVCGWCLGPIGAAPPLLQWGAIDFGRMDTTGAVVASFRSWLTEVCYRHKPQTCVYETPYVPRPGAVVPINPLTLRRLLGITGQIDAICHELRIQCRETTSGEFSKFMTGKGRWPGGRIEKKRRVIDACGWYGLDVAGSNDAADALAIWLYTESIIAPAASERRSREAADRERLIKGAGPLFMGALDAVH